MPVALYRGLLLSLRAPPLADAVFVVECYHACNRWQVVLPPVNIASHVLGNVEETQQWVAHLWVDMRVGFVDEWQPSVLMLSSFP